MSEPEYNKAQFLEHYRNILNYELSGYKSDKDNFDVLGEVKSCLDSSASDFTDGRCSEEDLVKSVNDSISATSADWTFPKPNREWCIGLSMAAGAALLAAWVLSGGTLIVGTVYAGVKVTSVVYAALIGGASASVLACIIGSCGDCGY